MRAMYTITESLQSFPPASYPALSGSRIGGGKNIYVENYSDRWIAYSDLPTWTDQHGKTYSRFSEKSCGGTFVCHGNSKWIYSTPWGVYVFSELGAIPAPDDDVFWSGTGLPRPFASTRYHASKKAEAEGDLVLTPEFPRWERDSSGQAESNAPWGFYSASAGSGLTPKRLLIGNPVYRDNDKHEYQCIGTRRYTGGLSYVSGTVNKWVIGSYGAFGGWWEANEEPDAFSGKNINFYFKKLVDDDSPVLPDKTLYFYAARPVPGVIYAGYYPIWH